MMRWLLALPLSVLCVLGLFMLMAAMVNPTVSDANENGRALIFDLVMVEPDSALNRRERVAPPKPETPQEPVSPPAQLFQSAQVSQSANKVTPQLTASSALSNTALPDIAFDMSVTGIAIPAPTRGKHTVGIPSSLEGSGSLQALPLYRIEPTYPVNALRRGIEGYVVIRFTIDEKGRPQDLDVVEASPKRVFNRDALRALKKWKYQPKRVDGNAVSQPNQTVKIEFIIAK